MADSDTRKAAMKAIKDLLDSEGYDANNDVAWPNSKFNANDKPSWMRVTFNPETPIPVTLGLGGTDRMRGFIQVDLNEAQDTSVAAFDAWEDKFRAQFFAGKTFTYGTAVLRILSVGMSGGRVFETWFRKSITITFRADLTRNSTP